MRKIVFTLITTVLTFTVFAQSVYVVNDPDGFVNVRADAGTNHDVVETIINKTVVFRDIDKPIINGWVPMRRVVHYGYIHESRLVPVNEPYALKLKDFYQKNPYDYPYYYYTVYMFSLNIPNLFVSYNSECEYIVRDLKTENIIFSEDVPNCLELIWGDTLSFRYKAYKDLLITYKLFEKNGEYDFYTEFSSEPPTVSIEEAELIVKNIREVIEKDINIANYIRDPTPEELAINKVHYIYFLPNIQEIWEQLFLAYCSGVNEAKDILENSGCDGALCHTLDFYLELLDALRRSKLNPKNYE